MRRSIDHFFVFFFVSLFFLYGFHANVYAIDGFIRITSPSGGETLQVGQSYTIKWESSSNIDKVNIGYKSCPSCLDWVVFTTPNTGSYNWNVFVGNTSNTQFTLQITGYETGKGSITSSTGTFTVNGGSTGGSNNSSSSQSSTSNSNSKSSYSIFRKNVVIPTSIPPTPTPIPLTVYNLKLPDDFIFEGSKTTILKDIKDPRHVQNFTIDTKEGWTLVFDRELDLTDWKKLNMLRNMDDYWVVEWWYVWIKIEWWVVFDTPCNITVKNEEFTGVKPKIVTSEQGVKIVGSLTPTPTKLPIPQVKKTSSGEVVLAVTDGGKIEIEPNVFFKNKPTKTVEKNSIELSAATSHKNLIYHLKINGNESSISASLKKDGSFNVSIPKLMEGANFIELLYKKKNADTTFIKADDVLITYKPNYFWYIVGGVSIPAVMILIALFVTFHHKRRHHKKTKGGVTQIPQPSV